MECIENKTFDEINIGDHASLTRRLTLRDIKLFAAVTGNVNPEHVDEDFAKNSRFHGVIAHGMWGGSLISSVLGTQLPGAGTIYTNLNLEFIRPVFLGDTVTVTVTAGTKDEARGHIVFDCLCSNENDEEVIRGQATVIAPREKIRRPRMVVPEVRVADRAHLHDLLEMARAVQPMPTAVVHPVNETSLRGALEAAQAELIIPLLIGPEAAIRACTEAAGLDLGDCEIIPVGGASAAAAKAVELVHDGRAEAIMKGALHTDILMHPIVNPTSGLTSGARLSHVFAFDVPTYERPVFITDAALNIYPDLQQKRDIIQNAIALLHALRIEEPRVAILSAVETVNPAIRSTLDAAALCKMADRGQITGGIVDGPLAFDNAVSPQAARIKGIHSPVAGRADIFVVPDLDAGNMLAKQLEYLADAKGAGVVVGAQVPIVLTSRADDALSRMASCAIALMQVHQRRITGS